MRAGGIRVRRGGHTLLDDVDVHVARGELVAVVGPNGAGKSTLLHVLAGDVDPDRGTVTHDGDDLRRLRPDDLARRRAVVVQGASVAFPFRVAQVVAMGRAPWRGRVDPATDEAAVRAAVAAARVGDLLDRDVTTLSGGEAARVQLARALAQTTPALLLDEPTAALDPGHADEVLRVLRARADAGDAVLAVLHDLAGAGRFADRVVLLAHGRVAAAGRPAEVLRPEVLSRAYGADVAVLAHPTAGTPVPVVR